MRIVVVGTVVADTIEHDDGGVTESLGGIAHTISVLSALAGRQHTIVPICRVAEDCRERVEEWAAGLEGVSLEAVLPVRGRQPTVRLSYGESGRPGERVERLRNVPEPLSADDMRAAAGADVAVVNCITGSDLTPAALPCLRGLAPRTYLDVHSLALGTSADGRRFYRGRDDWESWLRFADVVQCNLAEAATICGVSRDDDDVEAVVAAVDRLLGVGFAANSGRRDHPAPDDDRRRGNRLDGEKGRRRPGGDSGPLPGVWLLTLGAAGALLLRRRHGEITRTMIPAPRVCSPDPTGAGDAFGAGYVCAWVEGREPNDAGEQAVVAGAAACLLRGVPEPATFRGAVEDLRGESTPS